MISILDAAPSDCFGAKPSSGLDPSNHRDGRDAGRRRRPRHRTERERASLKIKGASLPSAR